MKNTYLIILLLLIIHPIWGQYSNIEMDSLKDIIHEQKGDTTEVNALANLADIYGFINLDSEIAYAQQGLLLAKKLNYVKGEARCYVVLGGAHNSLGNYSQ